MWFILVKVYSMTGKQGGEKRVDLVCTFLLLFIPEGRQDRNLNGMILDRVADVEAMKKCCLLGCFPWLVQPAFL